MRTRAVGLLSAAMVVGGLLATSTSPASAQLAAKPFSAYGSGDAVAVNALSLGTTTVAGLRAAASGGSVNTGGLTAITNEFGQNVIPANAGKNAYGRGDGLEAGVLTATPQSTLDINQLMLASLAQELAPPNQPPDPVTAEVAVPVNPALYASVLRGQANAIYDPVYCPIGKPLTYGLGNATNLQLVNLGGTTNPDGSFGGPLVGTSTAQGTPRAVNQSRTVTYLQPNGDGTYGLVSQTEQTLAPITLLAGGGLGTGLTVEVDGPIGFRVVATGKQGGASAAYTGNPLITVSANVAGVNQPIVSVRLQDIVGPQGLQAGLPGVLTVGAGAPPRAIGSQASPTPPVLAADGTSASAAVDTLRLTLLGAANLTAALDLALGHMEGSVTVPAGGITCTIPVSKTASVDPVTVGSDFQYKINIPADAAQFAALFDCDLTGIRSIDKVTVRSGNPSVTFLSADHGGVVSNGNTVTFADLGSYKLGDPPIVATINARISSGSGAGVLENKVDVDAQFGNCRGGTAIGSDIIKGSAKIDGSAVTGSFTLVGPNVSRGDLAATGGNQWPLLAGGGFLLAALGLVRLRRRATGAGEPAQS